MDNKDEQWKDITGYEGMYQVSNLGRIKTVGRVVIRKDGSQVHVKELIRAISSSSKGYSQVRLYKSNIGRTVELHRIVATEFIPNPENKTDVNHKDGNTKNASSENLEWVTDSENLKHAYRVLGMKPYWKGKRGVLNPSSKKVVIGSTLYESVSLAAEAVGVHRATISICIKKGYKVRGNVAFYPDIESIKTWANA